jgi:hypothetical protein
MSTSLQRGSCWGTWGSFTGNFDKPRKERSGNEASLSMEAVREEPEGRAHLLGTLKNKGRLSLYGLRWEPGGEWLVCRGL